jgi:hypothetical protein
MEYAIWEACVAVGVKPPGCKEHWEDCNVDTQAKIIAYHQFSEHHRVKEVTAKMKAGGGM